MNDNEQLVFELIKNNPFISQQEIADVVGLSRPAIANMISSLVKKGFILGKAYIVNRTETVVCIGAANVDKKIKTTHRLQPYTSNPVTSMTSIGGVCRNVAENLGRLGQEVVLISVAGNDSEWAYIKELSSPFMDTEAVVTIEGQSTGTYTALLDNDGEMYLGLADMSVYDALTPDVLSKQSQYLQQAKCIVMDLNCPKESIEYICSFAKKHEIPLILITVSEPKMERMPDDLSAVKCLITNVGETCAFFKTTLETDEDYERIVRQWQSLGVETVVLTQGAKRIIAANKAIHWYDVKALDGNQIADVTGAGDSFTAAFIDSYLNESHTMDDHVLAGMTNAYHTIQVYQTVRQNLTKDKLLEEIKEYRNE
ncbi:winged helix-turn-helix transcriptional regulator [Carnobacteriaceae bacterium zg-C25]|nr:winged helix-turn-helix transcriptional regulator [Carnobacteriaceae bacterium zg-C25]